MLSEHLQEQAALYAAGLMTFRERDQFELVIEFHDDLREFVRDLMEVSAALTLAPVSGESPQPALEAKARVLSAIAETPQDSQPEALVMSGPDGLVQWINPAFSEMCGYTLEELRGKKLGPILQGEKTDRETAARMRSAVHAFCPCRETILNYHKNGSAYWVDIAITPIRDASGQPLWLVAREYEVSGLPTP